jgi:Carboxypeptidase regulatory-like domain
VTSARPNFPVQAWGLVLALALLAPACLPAAEPNPQLDKQLNEALKEVHNRGADLYNSGDPNGCYRLFQGALLAVKPLLSHQAKAQDLIDKGLKEAELEPKIALRAFKLHETIEAVRSQLRVDKPAAAPGAGLSTGTPPSGTPGANPPTVGTNPPPPVPPVASTSPKPPESKIEVRGKVLLKGKPLPDATVTFIAAADEKLLFSTVTGADGSFALTTVTKPGQYKVVISAVAGGKQLIADRYSDKSKSLLTFEVSEKAPNNAEFSLTE